MIAKGPLGVKFNEKICAGLEKGIFTHSLLRLDGGQRDAWPVRKFEHRLGRAPNIGLANDEVEIAILTHAGFTVTAYGQGRAFGDQHLDTGVCKVFQQTK